ncbi:Dephospho-CoA kinase [Nitrosospira sp. Nsp11]|uniref:deoxynucleotide monophosphate kinase family protein n=1 Tax=Nitrosospira sp. Nsp11 TaxID=1855338 RepID=UPI00092366DC|nr:hypothetical protein [Nitrosospira sp. Nsp11]SHL11279.1 Dephospho-CoA kinase [Nitrosospira sp. Nsp11]
MNIIGLTGPTGSGKDTVARVLCETQGFVPAAFADVIRAAVSSVFGLDSSYFFDRAKKEAIVIRIGKSPRELMQSAGDWLRDLDPDMLLILLQPRITRLLKASKDLHINGIVISDVRRDNEARYVRDMGEIWHIHRTTMAHTGLASNTRLHSTEAGVEWKTGDRLIHNAGSIDDLYDNVNAVFTLEETSCQTTS